MPRLDHHRRTSARTPAPTAVPTPAPRAARLALAALGLAGMPALFLSLGHHDDVSSPVVRHAEATTRAMLDERALEHLHELQAR